MMRGYIKERSRCDAIICDVNYHVENHTCVQCGSNLYNARGDDASGPNTSCHYIYCDENEYVKYDSTTGSSTCETCPPGTYSNTVSIKFAIGCYNMRCIICDVNVV